MLKSDNKSGSLPDSAPTLTEKSKRKKRKNHAGNATTSNNLVNDNLDDDDHWLALDEKGERIMDNALAALPNPQPTPKPVKPKPCMMVIPKDPTPVLGPEATTPGLTSSRKKMNLKG
jgi:hypothetical protein